MPFDGPLTGVVFTVSVSPSGSLSAVAGFAASTSPDSGASSLTVNASSTAVGPGFVTVKVNTSCTLPPPTVSVAVMVTVYTPSPPGPPCEADASRVPLMMPAAEDDQARRQRAARR